MRRFYAVIGALALLSSTAMAADLPRPVFKASPPSVNGAGWYCGVGTEADVAQSNVTGTNLFATSLATGGLTATGGSLNAACGYVSGNPLRWWRAQLEGGWSNIQGTNAVAPTGTSSGASEFIAQRWHSSQEFDVGFELIQRIISAVPNLSNVVNWPVFTPPTPTVPVGSPLEYVGVGLREFGESGRFGFATGQTVGVAPMIKTGYLWQTLDTSGRPNGGALDAYAWVAFPMRGFTMGNVLAANGAPLTLGAGANMGTQYGLGLNYNFVLSAN
jgi:hypothetical protein